MDDLLLFRTFTNPRDAEAIAGLLSKNAIDVEVTDEQGVTDIDKPFNILSATYKLNLHAKDFNNANELIDKYYKDLLQHADPAYFLFQFSNDELIDVVLKPAEWGEYNVLLAKDILGKKGVVVSDELYEGIKRKTENEMATPEKAESHWIISGYAFALVGGLIGIMIGSYLATSTKTLPSGDRIYTFTSKYRKHGMRIVTIGLVMFVFLMLIRMGILFN